MVAELDLTEQIIEVFNECAAKGNYEQFMANRSFITKLCESLKKVKFENGPALCALISRDSKFCFDFLTKWNPKSPNEIVSGTSNLTKCVPEFVRDLKDAISSKKWDRFYCKYRTDADFMISEARKQNVLDFSIEYGSGMYQNFELRDETAAFYNQKLKKVEMNREDVRNSKIMIQKEEAPVMEHTSNHIDQSDRKSEFPSTSISKSPLNGSDIQYSSQNGITTILIDGDTSHIISRIHQSSQIELLPVITQTSQVNEEDTSTKLHNPTESKNKFNSKLEKLTFWSTNTDGRSPDVLSPEKSPYTFRSYPKCLDEYTKSIPSVSNQVDQSSTRNTILENMSSTSEIFKPKRSDQTVKSGSLSQEDQFIDLRSRNRNYENSRPAYNMNQIMANCNSELRDMSYNSHITKCTSSPSSDRLQDNNFSCDSPGTDNSSFEKELEKLKKKQAEELEETKAKRRKRQQEFDEEIQKMKTESKMRFKILWACIHAKHRFEEQEENWNTWIRGVRQNITNLSKRCLEFVYEIEKNHGGLRRLDKADRHELQIETCDLHSYMMGTYNTMQYDFEKLESVEKEEPDAMFIRVLMKCIVDVTTKVLNLYHSTENLGADLVKFNYLKTELDNLRPDLIYSTTQLRNICKQGNAQNYNIVFPLLKRNLKIEEFL